MSLTNIIVIYVVSIFSFLAIDFTWLGFVAKGIYQKELRNFLGPVNWPVAFLFYDLFILGLLIFVTIPAAEDHDLKYAALYGALYGFFTYMTYDLTNLSTLKSWPKKIVVIDIIWGTVLASSVASIGYFTSQYL